MSGRAVLSGSGLFTPPESISNEELVACFNEFVRRENERNRVEIEAGRLQPLASSSAEFIVEASGIVSRHVVDKAGILDPEVMRPRIRTRSNEEPSLLAEMAVAASKDALERAGRRADEIDGVIVACSNLQRPYPAIAVEVQQLLGTGGFGFDMNVACASAAFGMQTAADAVKSGSARAVLVANPEICTGHLNFRDRDSHFIFGDVATAVVVEDAERASSTCAFEIVGTRLATRFSNNIRNNFGFLNPCEIEPRSDKDRLFVQQGRKVFRDVVPMVADMILAHLRDLGIEPTSLKRIWLHQANAIMNDAIAKRVLGATTSRALCPVVLDEYANTSSAGSVIAFHKHQDGLAAGDLTLLCAFGAGYSAGTVVLRKL
jgi:beta-ketodecanoyl-[acyl-carrier-protein] synthase